MSILDTSDKSFWHGYTDFYESYFINKNFESIAEIGVFKGNSIRWLLNRFPKARIFGADILPYQEAWPVDDRFVFFQMDQGDVNLVRQFFSLNAFDLIIEDGSHVPEHQVLALIEGFKVLKSGGIYILEDIHTSHPSEISRPHSFFKKKKLIGNALSVLLGIHHYQRLNINITHEISEKISHNSLFNPDAVLALANQIKSIHLYKRTRLPDYCYKCDSTEFDYSEYKCICGVDVFKDSDSMTFVIEKK